jgi:hypothetical protein
MDAERYRKLYIPCTCLFLAWVAIPQQAQKERARLNF